MFLLRRPQNVRIPGDFLPPNRKLAACDDVGKCLQKNVCSSALFLFQESSCVKQSATNFHIGADFWIHQWSCNGLNFIPRWRHPEQSYLSSGMPVVQKYDVARMATKQQIFQLTRKRKRSFVGWSSTLPRNKTAVIGFKK